MRTNLGGKALAIAILMVGSQAANAATELGTFKSGRVTIRYATAGEGQPLVLLHGWMGDATSWGRGPDGNPKLNPPPGYKLIVPDLRGHGASEKLYDPKAYGPEMARDVIRLLDHLKVKKAHVVGYSMGSFVAGMMVVQSPSRVQSVVYGGGAPILDVRAEKRFRDAEAFSNAVSAGKGLGSYIQTSWAGAGTKISPEAADRIAESTFAGKDVKAFAAVGDSFPKMEVKASKWRANSIPSLFIHGELESAYVRERVQEAANLLENSVTVVIPKTNHITTLIAPTFGAKIVEFLDAHPIR